MKKLQKYTVLATLFALIALVFGVEKPERSVVLYDDVFVETIISFSASSSADSGLCIPLKETSSGSLKTNGKRSDVVAKHNICVIKSGRTVKAAVRYFNQIHSIMVHSSLIEPSHKLVSLGRLII